MVTKQIMKRCLWGGEIKQDSQNCYFSANDLVLLGNKWRNEHGLSFFYLQRYFQREDVKEFISFLEEKESCKAVIAGKGRNGSTWVHPFLFIKLALAISPELEVEACRWIYNSLVKYRNDSGDSYKKMCGALWNTQVNKKDFTEEIKGVAVRIRKACDVSVSGSDKEAWNKATEKQLQLRDKIHENIALLSDILEDREMLYKIAIEKAKKEIIL